MAAQSGQFKKPTTGNITIIKPTESFEKIHSSLIEDNDCVTVGVYCKVLRLGSSWNLNISGLAATIGIGSRTLRKIIVNLEAQGFVRRVPVRLENGRLCGWDYEFHASPASEEERTRAGRAKQADDRLAGEPTCRETDLSENRQVGERASQYIQTENNNKQNIYIKEPVSKDTEKKVAKNEYAPSVFLTEAEYRKLADEVKDDIGGLLEFYSNYKIDKSYKNKSDYLSIRRWGISGYYENRAKAEKAGKGSSNNEVTSRLIKQLQEEHDRGIKKEMEEKERRRRAKEELEKRIPTMSEYEKLYYEFQKLGYDKWDAQLQTDNTFVIQSRIEKAKRTPWQESEFEFIREGFKK